MGRASVGLGGGGGCVPFGAYNPHSGNRGGAYPPFFCGVGCWVGPGRASVGLGGGGLCVRACWVVTRVGGGECPKLGVKLMLLGVWLWVVVCGWWWWVVVVVGVVGVVFGCVVGCVWWGLG